MEDFADQFFNEFAYTAQQKSINQRLDAEYFEYLNGIFLVLDIDSEVHQAAGISESDIQTDNKYLLWEDQKKWAADPILLNLWDEDSSFMLNGLNCLYSLWASMQFQSFVLSSATRPDS